MNGVATIGEPESVRAGAATDIEHRRRRGRERTLEDGPRARALERHRRLAEPPLLHAEGIVRLHVRGQIRRHIRLHVLVYSTVRVMSHVAAVGADRSWWPRGAGGPTSRARSGIGAGWQTGGWHECRPIARRRSGAERRARRNRRTRQLGG